MTHKTDLCIINRSFSWIPNYIYFLSKKVHVIAIMEFNLELAGNDKNVHK